MNFDLTRLSFLTTILYIVLLSMIFWGGWVLMPGLAEVGKVENIIGTPLGSLIDSTFISVPLLGIILSSLLVFINSLIVTRVCVKNVIFLERSYMPALIYVIISAGYFNSFLSFRPLLVSTLFLIASNLIFRSYNIKSLATGSFLKIGFYMGFAAVISAPAIFLFPMLIVALITFRFFEIREWIVGIVGYALPLFFSMYVEWIMGGSFGESYTNFINEIITPTGMMPTFREVNLLEWGFIATISVLIILSIIKFTGMRKAYNNKAFKAYLFFIWMLVAVVAIMAFAPCRSLNMLPILATPLAVIIPTYFNASKPSFVMNFLYALLICEVITLHVVPKLI